LSTTRTPLNVLGAETMSSALPQAVEYHEWFYELSKPFLGERILDIGSGVGNHLPFFKGRDLICLDASLTSIRKLETQFGGPGREFVVGDICDEKVIDELAPKQIDTATCFNVLEHIEDHERALKNMRRILEPSGGNLILVVPAHEFLYGAMDHLAGHYRRFNKRQLAGLLRDCGFKVRQSRYMNAVGAVGWFVNGRVFKPKHLSTPSLNTQVVLFSRLLVPGIRFVESVLAPPFGQSLLAVATPL
jgi:SAM-dependent methyltransferase